MSKTVKLLSASVVLFMLAVTVPQAASERSAASDTALGQTPSVTQPEIQVAQCDASSSVVMPSASMSNLNPPVDATTLNHKVMFGYQGWFFCPNDGSRWNSWFHWFKSRWSNPVPSELKVDFWPDMSELPPEERFPTAMTLPDGRPAELYSAYRPATVDRHFRWMEEYGIDGVFVQRFITCLGPLWTETNRVLSNAKAGAEAHGRVFAVDYAISPDVDLNTWIDTLIDDWEYLVDIRKITQSPNYLHHNGLPVLGIGGLGFNDNPISHERAMELLDYFKSTAPEKYRATIMGGVPTHWRTLLGDSYSDPAWAEVYRSFDVIRPWTPGRYRDEASADVFRDSVLVPDMVEAATSGNEYMPVVFPGGSWHNMYPDYPLNDIPRNGGRFFWRQAYNVVASGATMLFVAMFDEVDEGTAMYKLAPTTADLPVGTTLIPLDIDGYSLPSDWYLRLGGLATRMMRGEIPPVSSFSNIAPTLSVGYGSEIFPAESRDSVFASFEFNGDTSDSSGNGRDAELIGGEFVPSSWGQSLHVFSSPNPGGSGLAPMGIDWSAFASLLVPPYTIEMVLTPTETDNGYYKIFSFDDYDDDGWYYNSAGFCSYPYGTMGDGTMLPGQRHYLAFVASAQDQLDVYFQGTLVGSTSPGFIAPPFQAIFFRDDRDTGREEQLDAFVDAMRISGTAKTPEEITAVQNSLNAPSVWEGSPLSLTVTFEDPGFDAFNFTGEERINATVDWGDGAIDNGSLLFSIGDQPFSMCGSFLFSHAYSSDGAFEVSVTVFDDDGGSASEAFTVHVHRISELTEALIKDIQSWDIQKGIAVGLTAKLSMATRMLDEGNHAVASHLLKAFTSMVHALDGKKLTKEQAAYALASAESIVDLIS